MEAVLRRLVEAAQPLDEVPVVLTREETAPLYTDISLCPPQIFDDSMIAGRQSPQKHLKANRKDGRKERKAEEADEEEEEQPYGGERRRD